MKARQDFEMHLDSKSGAPVPYKDGDSLDGIKVVKVKKGEDVPKSVLSYLLVSGRDYLEIEEPLKVKSKPIIPKRKYSQESLIEVYNKDGMDGLKKIGDRFDPQITDRSHSRLISEILTAQERYIREGKRKVP